MPTSDDLDEMDADLLSLVEKGLINMSYDAERGDWVFWLTDNGDQVAETL